MANKTSLWLSICGVFHLLAPSLLHNGPTIRNIALFEDEQVIASDKTLEHDFMHWQCLSRLFAARQAAGFPLDEAKPLVCYGADGDVGVELTILILKRELDHLVAQYKHNTSCYVLSIVKVFNTKGCRFHYCRMSIKHIINFPRCYIFTPLYN